MIDHARKNPQEHAPAGEEQAGANAQAAQEHAPANGQEHAPAEAGHDAVGHGAGGHGEEWGVETMIHHVADTPEWELEPITTLHLDAIPMPSFEIGGLHIDMGFTKHVLFLIFAATLTIITMFLAARASHRLDHGRRAPKGILNFVETFYLYLRDNVVMANIGRGGERFAPLVITFFFFILYANLLGLLPFGATATGNIMVTGALALIALVVIESAGFVALGPKGYAQTVFFLPHGLPGPLKPVVLAIMAPVELIGKFSKIVALAIRLFANMTAGHFVILALFGLILLIIEGLGLGPVGLLAIASSVALGLFVMLLEVFIAFVQAYIFAMLVSVFIGLIRHAH